MERINKYVPKTQKSEWDKWPPDLAGRVRDWRPWFAWHPVRCGGRLVWLKLLERRGCLLGVSTEDVYWLWEYRRPAK